MHSEHERGGKGPKGREKALCLNFSSLALKGEFLFHQHQSIYCWGLKWTQKAVTSKIISFISRDYLQKSWCNIPTISANRRALVLAHSRGSSQFLSFPLLVKKLFNLPTAISPDIWRKRGLFPSELGLRRGYTGKAELFLCSLWVKSMDIWKSRLKYHKKKLTVCVPGDPQKGNAMVDWLSSKF